MARLNEQLLGKPAPFGPFPVAPVTVVVLRVLQVRLAGKAGFDGSVALYLSSHPLRSRRPLSQEPVSDTTGLSIQAAPLGKLVKAGVGF